MALGLNGKFGVRGEDHLTLEDNRMLKCDTD